MNSVGIDVSKWKSMIAVMRPFGEVVVSPFEMLVHDYGNNSLRRAQTGKKDAIKLANHGLDRWLALPRYFPAEDTRLMPKTCYRQYQQYSNVQTMLKNNLISLLDSALRC